ncbi:MAG: hypothetical protein A2252_02815 [Elusimicrobia bacterium RIFOXYA2_FULL_39_19]|nr:MAG: hypothetical protein A2252_02815 [Elusimicrobia bacterium RIFOXYA2_FULL_39_19]
MNIFSIFIISIKNMKRHLRRTILNIISVSISIGILFFFLGYYRGTYIVSMRESFLKYKTSHAQIQTELFNDKKIQDYVTKNTVFYESDKLISKILKNPKVISATTRLAGNGFAGNGQEKMIVQITGCNPETEKEVGIIDDFIKEGVFLDKQDGILIGKKTAELFNLKLGDICFIQAQTINNSPNILQLPVTGIYATGFYELDKNTVFVSLKSANALFDTQNAVNKIFMFFKDMEISMKVSAELRPVLDNGLTIKPWQEYAQGLLENEKSDKIFYSIFILILLFIGVSTITGTMYVNVYERVREIGMLRAMGWLQNEIFLLFLFESLCIGLAGSIFGLFIGGIPTFYLAVYGIDYSQAADMIAIPVFKLISKPAISDVLLCIVVGMVSTMLGGLLPAHKASKMIITDSLRTN